MGMIKDDSNLLFIMKAFLERLPFGVLMIKNEKEVFFCNQLLSKHFEENAMEFNLSIILERNMLLETTTHIHLPNKDVVIRKMQLEELEDVYHLYLFSFTNASNRLLNIEENQEILLKDMMESAYDGLVMVDTDGYIQLLTQAYADFLGVDQKSAIGKHVTEVIENTRMHVVVKTGKQETAELQKINKNYIIATRSPMFKQGKVVGAVGKILFKNVGQFTALFKRLRSLEIELKKYKGDFRESNKASYTFDDLIGSSPSFIDAKNQAKKASRGDSNVLLLGETGTGKELFAHSIHNESRRAMGVFVKVNCAAIPAELLESELFGYEEGSFTGAKKGGKAGKFEAADGGTIFLDEIGELPIHMQVKLLRVLQEKEIERVGSTVSTPIDVRVIAATNRNLEEMVEKGEFRLDLFYRLKVMEINIPSLKERKQDIETLVSYFLNKYEQIMKKHVQRINDHAQRLLTVYSWPGNIRELENIIERALNIVDEGDVITPHHLPEEITGQKEEIIARPLADLLEETERNAIVACLKLTNGNKSETAKQLKVSRTTLYEKMNKHGLLL
ncbi:sigma-54 interaction domain-containing protein [Bacillus chungangensis]|uniref:PAS domain S-box-containing protein n=1 Tax=Bacillus chungangensis TaxID=587633 RepID=A0ABT9WT47_9BACI|nr:sigma 54-interacting transcriptional regulator [Bacillus chungangensis]MDQ0176470.1 PAS domain S-box-containing protein [Bacillus chungangensis]